jgi:hypothetical protein
MSLAIEGIYKNGQMFAFICLHKSKMEGKESKVAVRLKVINQNIA